MKKIIVKIGIGLYCIVFVPMVQVSAQSVSIDLNTTYQTIRGFGGIQIPAWTGTDLNEDMTEKAFGNDPGKIGLSILRLRIAPDSNQFYRELPFAQHAVNRGAIVFASPWNPPAEMLDPGSSLSRLHPDYYDDYVEHLNRYTTYMADNGVPLYAISVQNEPDYGEWTRWTAGEMIKFLEENAQNIEAPVIAPESFQFRRPYTDSILNDPEAVANLDIVGGHIYGGGLFDYPLARDKGKEVWMTEHLTGSSAPEVNTWPLALALGTEISDCMEANFNAYVWWYIRRFYGLITDDGNISKKGYVMSQFAKFVRPGAVRVDALTEGVSGVDATAYRTDSSLVIVVVNTNSTQVNIDFTIGNNIGIDSLIQFTSSETKNMVNEGGISLSGNTFSASLDANSLSTFTSHAAMGGKVDNVPPMADAGEDILVDDLDGNGIETIILDGSGSTDTDGVIVNYSWSWDGQQIAWEDSLEVSVAIGEHVAVLTVTDEDGASHSDTLLILVNSIFETELWFESECALVGSTWELHADITASHGEYIATPAGTELLAGPSDDTADQLIISFHIEEAGPYKVWGRVITPTANDDSYWVQMDTSSWANWNSIPASSAWHWDDVHDGGNDNTVIYDLETGDHTLRICYREDGALLDKLYITNTGNIPTGLGEVDETCPQDTLVFMDNRVGRSEISVFPNPTQGVINIAWSDGFNSLSLVSLDGRTVLQQEYPLKMNSTELECDLEQGVYFLILMNENSMGVSKFVAD